MLRVDEFVSGNEYCGPSVEQFLTIASFIEPNMTPTARWILSATLAQRGHKWTDPVWDLAALKPGMSKPDIANGLRELEQAQLLRFPTPAYAYAPRVPLISLGDGQWVRVDIVQGIRLTHAAHMSTKGAADR